MRKVFTDELPRWENGINKGKINWEQCIGHKVRFIYNDIQGEVEIIDYYKINNSRKYNLLIKYLNKPMFEIFTGHFQKCQLGKLLDIKTDEFKIKIGQRFKDDKRDIIIVNKKYERYKNRQNKKYYKYKCNKCGFDGGEHYKNGIYQEEHWILESDLLGKKVGCSCCCPNPQITVQGINDMWTTNPNLAKLLLNIQDGYKYTKWSNQKINWKCLDCGEIIKNKIISDINRQGLSCPRCSDGYSYPNKFCYSLLKQLNINFITEYSPEWIKPKKYDFYFELNNRKYIAEMDGGLGHGNKVYNKSKLSKEETKLIDDYKDLKAKEHNIEIIRINCKKSELEYIKNKILHSQLNNIFDLGNIAWLKCEEFARGNLVKKVCELKKDNPNLTTREIGEIINLNYQTIIKYLKLGSEIWSWCNYNPKEESLKGSMKAGKMSGKPVEIFKDGILLGQFESCAELRRQSEELFGVKLLNQSISAVCNSKIKQYKGFTFKYI